MYALHVTFTTSASAAELRPGQLAFAEHVGAVPGFVSKTWLHDGNAHGGFYLFTDREAAQAYLDGPLFAMLRGNPAFADLTARGWAVDTELGALTGAGTAGAVR